MRLRRAIEVFDIESYIHSTFDPVTPSGDDELRVDCFSPNGCNGSDEKQHLWVNIHKRAWICYKCGYGDHTQQPGTGSLIRFIADAEGLSYREVKHRLVNLVTPTPAEELGELVEVMLDDKPKPKEPRKIILPSEFKVVADFPTRALQYMKRRGFSKKQLESYDVRFCEPTVKRYPLWRRRLTFPIYDLEGELRSATGRILEPFPPSYKNAPKWRVWADTDIQELFWPLGMRLSGSWCSLRDLKPDHVIVVEGINDAYAIEQVTGYYALAAFGKKLSDEQVALLQELDLEEVTLAFDYNGRKVMPKLVKKLAGRFDRVSVFPYLWDGWQQYDFGDMSRADLKHIPFSEKVVTELLERIQIESTEYMRWEAELRF